MTNRPLEDADCEPIEQSIPDCCRKKECPKCKRISHLVDLEKLCPFCDEAPPQAIIPNNAVRNCLPPQEVKDWEEELIAEVMDDYLGDARNLAHLDVEPMQAHFEKLKAFIRDKEELARGQGILAVKEGKYPLSYSEWEAMGEKYQYNKFLKEKVCAEVLEKAKLAGSDERGKGLWIDTIITIADLDTIVRNISQDNK